MKAASEQRLNAHNQYLQTTVALGVIGLLVLILILLLPALQAYRQNNFPYFVFLVLLGFNLLFESMLETQAGVVFYAFFNVVLYQKNQ
jgi:O-antigen ligase